MNNFASMIPPNQPIPEPPEIKILAAIAAVLCSLGVVAVIVFIAVEFTMDLIGSPLHFGDHPRPDLAGPDDQSARHGNKKMNVDQMLSEFQLLSPLHQSRISGNRVHVLCAWDRKAERNGRPPIPLRLYVDDFLIPWDIQFGNNAWVARLSLPTGPHRLRTSVFDAEIYVDGSPDLSASPQTDSPPDWPEFKSHHDIDDPQRCGDCHHWIERPDDVIRKGYGITVGPWKGSASCLSCHPASEFERTHRHRLAPQENCRLCHAPHGTTIVDKALLRDTPNNLCSQCHEPP